MVAEDAARVQELWANPDRVAASDLVWLEELVAAYPAAVPLWWLYVRAVQRAESPNFAQVLQRCAAISPDRSALLSWVEEPLTRQAEVAKPEPKVAKPEPKVVKPETEPMVAKPEHHLRTLTVNCWACRSCQVKSWKKSAHLNASRVDALCAPQWKPKQTANDSFSTMNMLLPCARSGALAHLNFSSCRRHIISTSPMRPMKHSQQ